MGGEWSIESLETPLEVKFQVRHTPLNKCSMPPAFEAQKTAVSLSKTRYPPTQHEQVAVD
jgi:hypothetical protein